MAAFDRRDGVFDDPDDDREDRDSNGDDDIVGSIWAAFASPPPQEAPSISVESIKERLKRGAARRAGQHVEE